MSFAKPLVVAFSLTQLDGPVRERINAVDSALLYLEREGVSAINHLSTFISPAFYVVADAKRAFFNTGETAISLSRKGLQEFGYILSGQVGTVSLTDEQRDVVEDLGFTTTLPVSQLSAEPA